MLVDAELTCSLGGAAVVDVAILVAVYATPWLARTLSACVMNPELVNPNP